MLANMTAPICPVAVVGAPPSARLLYALARVGVVAVASTDVVCVIVVGASVVERVVDRPWLWLPPALPPLSVQSAAVIAGCVDVIACRGVDEDAVAAVVAKRVRAVMHPPLPIPAHERMVANSSAGQALLKQLAQAAATAQPVLITGETGTGKDVAAHLIHEWSARRTQAFVPINCSAIPNELIEAELFGYSKGAFSGAVKNFDGQLGAAAGGSVFLDEIDDTPLSLQMKLLRVLEDRVVTRLGESDARRVDFRIVAATNRDLKLLVARGEFGADLFERLATVRIEMPPLRARLDDLPALIALLLKRFDDDESNVDDGARERVVSVSPQALAALAAYPWPGNIRELRNVIFEALVYKRGGDELLLSDLPRRLLLRDVVDDEKAVDDLDGLVRAGRFNLKRAKDDLEKRALQSALRVGGSATAAAKLLGTVGRGNAQDPGDTVRAMMRRHGLKI
jgi:transcriptional regulator with PAS, ATPase and Fis domain